MNPIPSLIEEMALAIATSQRFPGTKLRMPSGPLDYFPDADGVQPIDWACAEECRQKAQAIVDHLSTFESFSYEEDATELDLAAFDIECGLTYPSTPLTFAFRRAMLGEGSEDFGSPGYQWSDKPHRLVFTACEEIERQAHVIAEQKNALVKCLALIDDMSRFVGKMSLQNYALFNEAPMLARLLTRDKEPAE